SGFLICSRLVEERHVVGRVRLGAFYIRRAFRILPPMLAYLLVLLALHREVPVGRIEFLSALTFWRNYLPAWTMAYGQGWYTNHYWSLAVEEHYYMLWPCCLILLPYRKLPWIAGGVALVVAVARHVVLNRPWLWPAGQQEYFHTELRLDGLLLGAMLALLVDLPEWRTRLSVWTRPAVWWGVALMLVGSIVAAVGQDGRCLLLGCLVLGTVLHPATWVGRLLESNALRWIGRLSYSLYLWQQLFMKPVAMPAALPVPLQTLPINFCAALLCAWLSYRFLERPLIRLGHRLSQPVSEGRGDL
ncbi:MAG TPA: acyltransferase, partial [Candidatus Xenobia bacterium]